MESTDRLERRVWPLGCNTNRMQYVAVDSKTLGIHDNGGGGGACSNRRFNQRKGTNEDLVSLVLGRDQHKQPLHFSYNVRPFKLAQFKLGEIHSLANEERTQMRSHEQRYLLFSRQHLHTQPTRINYTGPLARVSSVSCCIHGEDHDIANSTDTGTLHSATPVSLPITAPNG
jgi:hypothetical protein